MITQLVAEYRAYLEAKYEPMGIRITEDTDFERMDNLLIEQAGEDMPGGPNPMFSPKYNRMTSDRCFWIGLENESGELISTAAAKKFDFVDDIEGLWRTLRVVYDDDSKPVPPDEFIMDTKFPEGLEGTISITGRGWTRSDYRRRGLVRDLAVLSRAECLSRWLVDWHLGTTTAKHISGGRESSCFAYDPDEGVDYLGFYLKSVGEEKTMHLHLLWINPDQIVKLLSEEIERHQLGQSGVAAE
jgi:hypothetical protein